ncbi:MAG: primosomal protein N' [Bacteroidia bacterium]|nr:primosomal protein N' [Bacteroidia bacterium]
MKETLYSDIILPLALSVRYTYRVPVELENKISAGSRVVVQFGKNKLYSAIVYNLHHNKPEQDDIKDILSMLDESPVVTDHQLRLWEWMAEYYMCTLGEVYKAALPSGLKLESESKIISNPQFDESVELTEKEKIIRYILQKKNTLTIKEANRLLEIKNSLPVIKSLLEKNAISIEQNLVQAYKPKFETYLRITPGYSTPEKINLAFVSLKRAGVQQKLLSGYIRLSEIFLSEKPKEVTKKELLNAVEKGASSLKSLLGKKILEEYTIEISRVHSSVNNAGYSNILSEYQQTAFDKITESFKTHDTILMNGVTSSGKTEIYIHMIREFIKQEKQVLYLLPEIALTAQIIGRLRIAFGNNVGIYHSKLSDAERVELWNSVLGVSATNKYQVILGVRSSIFLPFKNLGLVIIDEEHENTYKQFDPAPRYHARDAAIVLAKLHGAKTLLGSASPSVDSWHNAKTGKFGWVEITQRYQDMELPEIIIADIRESLRKKNMRSHFTPLLINSIHDALQNKEQVILFQNRRGFSPYIQCGNCGWIPKCTRCNVSLAYHKNPGKMICHYCNYTVTIPGTCSECSSKEIHTCGFGTEKIEEEIALYFPDAKISRLDLDAARTRKNYEKIIRDFEEHKTDILIGTQMITKGFDFDRVSVAGILNADNMLNYPDFRAFERSFQGLMQVSGRAGGKNKRGKVILQTSDPRHPLIQDFLYNNFAGFYNTQINERKTYNYPPFCRLVKLTLKHKNEATADHAARELMKELKLHFGDRALGPETPVVNRIQNRFIKNIMVKLDKNKSLGRSKENLRQIITRFKSNEARNTTDIIIDVDPV